MNDATNVTYSREMTTTYSIDDQGYYGDAHHILER